MCHVSGKFTTSFGGIVCSDELSLHELIDYLYLIEYKANLLER